ncbi:hypothetical protein [Streptomyces sp. NPDC057428]|uniref:hypothetical protein n=1 Tax=Streptomyces sp. NPDC057428 TaxID=3346129 RepID=UPI0036C4DF90
MTISEPATRHGAVLQEADARANRQLTTLEGWRRFAAGPPQPVVMLPADQLRRLSPVERALYPEFRS